MKIGHFLKGGRSDSSQSARGSYSLSPLSTGNDGNTALLGMTKFLAPRTSHVFRLGSKVEFCATSNPDVSLVTHHSFHATSFAPDGDATVAWQSGETPRTHD
jgi:hypothetical protein